MVATIGPLYSLFRRSFVYRIQNMKRVLLVLVFVLVVGGFVRGWFVFSGPQRNPETKKVDVNLTIDPEKMKDDARRLEEEAEELKDRASEEFRKE